MLNNQCPPSYFDKGRTHLISVRSVTSVTSTEVVTLSLNPLEHSAWISAYSLAICPFVASQKHAENETHKPWSTGSDAFICNIMQAYSLQHSPTGYILWNASTEEMQRCNSSFHGHFVVWVGSFWKWVRGQAKDGCAIILLGMCGLPTRKEGWDDCWWDQNSTYVRGNPDGCGIIG